MDQVAWARDLAARLLAEPLPRRWSHVHGVGSKAESIAHIVGDDAEMLVCAAWLHDIGYAPELVTTGLHSLDGARYLRDIKKVDDQLCRLVANHSFALIEARNRGLALELTYEFPAIGGLVSMALTYCDMTTSPDGDPVDVRTRIEEILERYDSDDVVARSMVEAQSQIQMSTNTIAAKIHANSGE